MRKNRFFNAGTLGLLGFFCFVLSFTLDYLKVEGLGWRFTNNVLIGLSIIALGTAVIITLVKSAHSK